MNVLTTSNLFEKSRSVRKFVRYALLSVLVTFLLPTQVQAASDSDDSTSYSQSSSNSVMSSRDMKKIGKWIDKGKYEKAIKRLNKFAKKDDKNPDVWNLLGFTYRKQGKHELSAEAYTTALTLDPEHKGALEYQGELYLTLGDKDAAMDNLELLKSLCPAGCHELEELQEAMDAAG